MLGLWQLLYHSTEAYEMDASDLLKLLIDARGHNAEHRITGLLLYHDRRFMQLLEGGRETVQTLYRKIQRDPRHSDLVLETEGPASVRMFSTWHMAFVEVPKIDGNPVLDSVESELDTALILRSLSINRAHALRMLQFLGESDVAIQH